MIFRTLRVRSECDGPKRLVANTVPAHRYRASGTTRTDGSGTEYHCSTSLSAGLMGQSNHELPAVCWLLSGHCGSSSITGVACRATFFVSFTDTRCFWRFGFESKPFRVRAEQNLLAGEVQRSGAEQPGRSFDVSVLMQMGLLRMGLLRMGLMCSTQRT